MNKCIFLARFVTDPEKRYSQSGDTAITRGRVAVGRRIKREGEPDADFLNIVAFGKDAENIDKFFQKGSPILITSHVQTGSYTNKNGQKVYTTDFVVDEWEFVGAKTENGSEGRSDATQAKAGEFVPVPTADEDLPWD